MSNNSLLLVNSHVTVAIDSARLLHVPVCDLKDARFERTFSHIFQFDISCSIWSSIRRWQEEIWIQEIAIFGMTPTGRRHWRQFWQFSDPRGQERPAESCLERGNLEGNGLGKRSKPATPSWKTSFLRDGARQFLAGWSRIQQPWDVIELFSMDAPLCLWQFRQQEATQPHDGGLGNSLRTLAAREQLFEDVESWKPLLIVAYLPDWTPEVSELALELVRRQNAAGRDLLLRFPINNAVAPRSPWSWMKSGLRNSGWSGGWYSSTDTTILVGGDNEGFGQTVEWMRAARSKCLTGVSFFFAPWGKIGRPSKESFLCSRCGTYIRTHPDPGGNIIRRRRVGSKRPSSSDTRNQNGLETSSCESCTSHQWRFDEVPRCRWRHPRGTKGSEMYAMLSLRKDDLDLAATGHLVSRRTENASTRGCSWTCVTWWMCVEADTGGLWQLISTLTVRWLRHVPATRVK